MVRVHFLFLPWFSIAVLSSTCLSPRLFSQLDTELDQSLTSCRSCNLSTFRSLLMFVLILVDLFSSTSRSFSSAFLSFQIWTFVSFFGSFLFCRVLLSSSHNAIRFSQTSTIWQRSTDQLAGIDYEHEQCLGCQTQNRLPTTLIPRFVFQCIKDMPPQCKRMNSNLLSLNLSLLHNSSVLFFFVPRLCGANVIVE